METTTAYIFGILTVVAITLVMTTVIGIVKILKQQRTIQSINKELESIFDSSIHFCKDTTGQYLELSK